MSGVTIVVPMFRTATTATALHERLSRALENEPTVSFVYVDDACDQGSGVAISALETADDRINSQHHMHNRGQHEAIRTGLRAASGDHVVVLDADLQDPPEAIPAMLTALRGSEFDAVFAGRRGTYEGRGRLASGRAFKWFLHKLSGTPRDAGGFVAMTRPLVDDILERDLSRAYLLAEIAATGRPTTSVPVQRDRRPVGRSATTTRTRLGLAAGALVSIRTARRR